MGVPTANQPSAKLIVGLIGGDVRLFDVVKKSLQKKFGPIESESNVFDFVHTRYYEEEFGCGLKRLFIVFCKPISLSKNHRIKLYTNKLEKKLSSRTGRCVNIDPGYMGLSSLTLFTTKERSHRIYLDSRIYAEVELQFAQGTFVPLEWTYPDYRTKDYIDFFNSVRRTHLAETRKGFKV